MLFLIGLLQFTAAVEWAVIVAGSNTYTNYRHQSDVCHAYQIAHKNGIPDDRIIVMQYDDIANNIQNPYKGQIFNKPTATGVPGTDVYAGCKKDYVGINVTAAHFLGVITGDSTASGGGKVLQSGPDDHVFINFVDHGGTGIVAFPVGPYLTSTDLNAALQTMVKKQLFGELTFYVEACEAGSMFEGILPTNQKIYVTTASNAEESSWGTYCPPDDYVNGKEIGSCLGDLYSVNWMEDTDISGHTSETLQVQYTTVQTETTLSHVMQYGDLSFVNTDTVGDFLGNNVSTKAAASASSSTSDAAVRARSAVRTTDIPMHLAYYRYLRSDGKSIDERRSLAVELLAEIQHRLDADQFFMTLAHKLGNEKFLTTTLSTPCTSCCGNVYQAYADHCGRFTDYSLQYTKVLANACKSGVAVDTIVQVLDELC